MGTGQRHRLIDASHLHAHHHDGHHQHQREIEQHPAQRCSVHVVIEDSNHVEGRAQATSAAAGRCRHPLVPRATKCKWVPNGPAIPVFGGSVASGFRVCKKPEIPGGQSSKLVLSMKRTA